MLDQTEHIESALSAQLLSHHERMEEELLQARSVQRYLLPPENQTLTGCKLSHFYQPLYHVGGDFLDTLVRPDGILALMIADVSGHGIAAALSSAMLKHAFLRFATTADSPATLLNNIDRELRDAFFCGRFVTALAAFFDPASRRLTMASAGHPHPIRHHDRTAQPLLFETGLPLFTGEDFPYENAPTVTLDPADRVLFYTDGLIETLHDRPEADEVQDICQALAPPSACPPDPHPAAKLFESLLFGNRVFRDDVTLLLLDCL